MSPSKIPYGTPVKLLADYQSYPNGRLVQFEIWRKKEGKEEKIADANGVTRDGQAIGKWTPLNEREEVLPLQERINEPTAKEEEKYYFIAKIDKQKAKSDDIMFTYPLDIYIEDENRKPLDGTRYTVTFLSDGSKKEGKFKSGHIKFEDAPSGKFKIELEDYEFVFGMIKEARWEKNKAKCGDQIKMTVDLKGFEAGTPARFIIWKEGIDQKKEAVKEIEAEVHGDKVEAIWGYSPEETEEDLEKSIEDVIGEPKFFFEIKIKEEKAKSDFLTLTYPIDIRLKEEDGNSLGGAEYTITLSDGTERNGKLEDGHALIEDTPYGRFTLKVKEYGFIFKKAT
jgi:hypothetical protein